MRSADEQLDWLRSIAADNDAPQYDRLGTLRFVDTQARLRAGAAIRHGHSVSLSRTLVEDDGYEVTPFYGEPEGHPETSAAFDRLAVACHGLTRTHIDGLNHISYDGSLYSGWAFNGPDGPSPYDWAHSGIFARALHADIGSVRQTPWCAAEEPLTGQDLSAAIALLDADCLPGDALLIDMGRDRFEAAGHSVRSQLHAPEGFQQPGLGPDAAEWILDHRISVVCWDFLDAVTPGLSTFSGHSLIWAIGQVFVDNCSFAALRDDRAAGRAAGIGALVVSPLAAPRTTGCVVNPLFLS